MGQIDVDNLRKLAHDALDAAITQWAAGASPEGPSITPAADVASPANEITSVVDTPERVLPEGKRVVRTKSSGDRVYYLDDDKMTRQWVTNPDVLKGLGFEIGDVVEVDDNELMKYNMASAIYKSPEA